MSLLFSTLARLRRSPLRPAMAAFDRAAYWALYRVSPARRLHFFNSGYAPLAPDLLAVPALADEPYQTALFDFVLRGHAGALAAAAPRRLLEVGVGLGGGILYSRTACPDAEITGIDADPSAIAAARRRISKTAGVRLQVARGDALPFADGTFDRVVSVGTAGYIGIEAFMAETARVLAPGGHISFSTGFTDASWDGISRLMGDLAQKYGLAIARLTDITPNVLAALDADIARREALIRPLPPPLRGYAREWADLPGTERHARYAAGRRIEFAAVLTKPLA